MVRPIPTRFPTNIFLFPLGKTPVQYTKCMTPVELGLLLLLLKRSKTPALFAVAHSKVHKSIKWK